MGERGAVAMTSGTRTGRTARVRRGPSTRAARRRRRPGRTARADAPGARHRAPTPRVRRATRTPIRIHHARGNEGRRGSTAWIVRSCPTQNRSARRAACDIRQAALHGRCRHH